MLIKFLYIIKYAYIFATGKIDWKCFEILLTIKYLWDKKKRGEVKLISN